MAEINANQEIINSWSLVNFAKAHGRMKIGGFTNSKTDEPFKSCIFVDGESRVFVNFSSKLGELSAAEIVAQKDDLQVVLLDSGKYKLCRRGESTWEDVEL